MKDIEKEAEEYVKLMDIGYATIPRKDWYKRKTVTKAFINGFKRALELLAKQLEWQPISSLVDSDFPIVVKNNEGLLEVISTNESCLRLKENALYIFDRITHYKSINV